MLRLRLPFHIIHLNIASLRRCGDEAHISPGDRIIEMRNKVVAQLTKSPENAVAWNDLGVLAAGTTVCVGGVSYTERECYLAALRHGANCADCWNNLAGTMSPSETITVAGGDVAYSRVGCHIQALRLNHAHWAAWMNLATALEGSAKVYFDNRRVSRAECFAEAIRWNSDYDTCASVDSRGAKLVCLLQLAEVLGPLGTALDADGKMYTAQLCYIAALGVEPDCAVAWAGLGVAIPAGASRTVNGYDVSRVDALVRALELRPASHVWTDLGDALGWHPNTVEYANVSGTSVTRLDCHVAAVRSDVANGVAWLRLGGALLATPGSTPSPVHVGNAPYNAVDCLVRAAVYDNSNPVVWDLLADAVGTGRVRVVSKMWTADACRAEAARLRSPQ